MAAEKAKLDLYKLLENQIVICDGAMGTVLYQRGIPYEHNYPYANLTHPHLVKGVHSEYVQAGVQIIETNTYGAGRLKLSTSGLEGLAAEINRAGVKLAREASEGKALVGGAIGPVGKPLKPVGMVDPEDAGKDFHEQATVLLDAGVDLIILETFSDLEELRIALEAVRGLTDKPVIVHKTFIEDGETLSEGLPRRVCETILGWGAEIVGANCTVGPQRMLQIVQSMAEAGKGILSAMPTAGLPQLIKGRITYDATPDYFARYGRLLAEAGANIIGGCCGTTPEHIKALAVAVRGMKPVAKQTRRVEVIEKKVEAQVGIVQRSRFAQKLGRKYVTTVELDLPRGIDMSKVLKGAELLRDKGVDSIDISDGARARLRMNPMVVAHLIQRQVGIEVMMHFSCRDRNLLGMQSDLLGAHALGLRNILAITGDPAQIGDYPEATSVFDIDAIGLVHILSKFNQGVDLAGNTIVEKTAFLIAVAFNPLAEDLKTELDRLKRKADAGAEVIYTQPVYDITVLDKVMGDVNRLKLPLLVGILPLRSSRHAEFLHNEVPGIFIPEHLRKRLSECTDEDAAKIGIEVAQRFLLEAKPMTAGAYLMPPFGRAQVAAEVLKVIGLG